MRLKAVIRVDLPSYIVYEEPGALGRFFGVSKKSTGETRVLADSFTLVDQLINGFKSIGITNAIALKVDNKMIYKDAHEREDDVEKMISALDRNQYIISERFELLQMAMECKREGIQYIFDTQVRAHVKLGKEEVCTAVSAKILELDQKSNESPGDHRERIRKLLGDDHFIETYRLQFKLFLEDVLQKLKIHTNAISATIQYILTEPEATSIVRQGVPVESGLSRSLRSAMHTYRSAGRIGQVGKRTVTGRVSRKQIKRVTVSRSSSQGYSKTITSEEIIDGFDDFSDRRISPLDLLDNLMVDIGPNLLDIDASFSPRKKS